MLGIVAEGQVVVAVQFQQHMSILMTQSFDILQVVLLHLEILSATVSRHLHGQNVHDVIRLLKKFFDAHKVFVLNDVVFKPTAEIIYLFLGVTHEDGTFLVPLKLWCHAIDSAECRNGDQFAFGRSELVTGEDITK